MTPKDDPLTKPYFINFKLEGLSLTSIKKLWQYLLKIVFFGIRNIVYFSAADSCRFASTK
jgi:hypothetical protein